jgi:hypothetical protein
MTVSELIAELSKYPASHKVVLCDNPARPRVSVVQAVTPVRVVKQAMAVNPAGWKGFCLVRATAGAKNSVLIS